jgi:hypothetical protein
VKEGEIKMDEWAGTEMNGWTANGQTGDGQQINDE